MKITMSQLRGMIEEVILDEKKRKKKKKKKKKKSGGKKDACYHKVKARYDVWPSAYASGALVKCRKVGAKNWGNKSKKESYEHDPLRHMIREAISELVEKKSNPRIPRKKGQKAKSKKHSDLYTDEDPKGTIHGLKFATEADAKKSVTKIKKSSRSHAHKVQAAVAMEQRAKAAGKASAAAVYRKYIDSVKKDENIDEDTIEEKKKSGGKKDGKGASSKGYSLRDWFKGGGWVQTGGKYDGKPCAKQPGQKTKPYCRDPDDRAKLSKKEKNKRAAKKRKEDPNPNRKGKAKNVSQKKRGKKG